jgi:glycerol-3-phosphate dehydrogenase
MVAFDYETDAVVNRCRPSDNGDIVVPHVNVSVAGTTDEEVENPDDYPREDWEVELMRDEGARMIPALVDAEVAYTNWGVRPLYDPSTGDGRATVDAPRGFAVLDHTGNVEGFTSVVGGKLTTYRMMAERTVDHICEKLGVGEGCETAERRLPDEDEELEEKMNEWRMDEASVF